ncbi:MAG: hypothetical protein JWO94_3372 [Verrucomicrobiaceae bacterium]|nr:hypothetical protein [Verrucomicrobiaceae bacterium]
MKRLGQTMTLLIMYLSAAFGQTAKFAECTYKSSEGVIVSVEYTDKNLSLFQNKDGTVKGGWLPSIKDIEVADAKLDACLPTLESTRKLRQQTREIIKSMGNCRRQYVGLLVASKQFIRIRALPPVPVKGVDRFKNWKSEYPEAYDGGSMYWQIDFDSQAGTFVNLIVGESP